MEEVDFFKAAEEARKHINTWVANKTEGESILFLFSNRTFLNRTVSSPSTSDVNRNAFPFSK